MSRPAQMVYILRNGDLFVAIWRYVNPDTDTYRYTVSPGRCPQDDAPPSEMIDNLGFDELLPAVDELLRRAGFRKRDISVMISRHNNPDTGSFRYAISSGRCSAPADAPWGEMRDNLGLDDLLPAVDELLRRAAALPISATAHDEPNRRDADLRTMAWLLCRAHAVITDQEQADTRLCQKAAGGEG